MARKLNPSPRISKRQRIKTYGAHFLDHLNHLILDGFLSPFATVVRTGCFFLLLFLFFITALVSNVLQFLNYLAFAKIAPNLRRRINHFLQDVIISSLLYVFEWQCPVRFRVCFNSRETEWEFAREKRSFIVCNHQFQLDILFYYLAYEMCGQLGGTKGFAKDALRRMPIIGTLFVYADNIFLKRKWDEDQEAIEAGLDVLQSYKIPYLLAIAPEGTRYTKEKYEASLKFAEQHNISFRPKHHLLPRVKGFASTLRHLRKTDPNYPLYNMEMICEQNPEGGSYEPTIKNVILGRPFRIDCYIEKLSPTVLPEPDASDEEYTRLMYDIYAKKDQLVDEHREFGRFPQAVVNLRRPSTWRLVKFVFYNVLLTGGALVYLMNLVFFASQSVVLKVLVLSFVFAVFGSILVAFKMTGNSSYGTEAKKA